MLESVYGNRPFCNLVRRSREMVIEWLKKLGGANTGKPRDNGTDRNAVIQRVVAGAAADTLKKTDSAVQSTATVDAPRPPSTPPVVYHIPRDKVAQRAYEMWVRKGKPFGTSDQDWLEAEAEVRAELTARPDGEPLPNKPR